MDTSEMKDLMIEFENMEIDAVDERQEENGESFLSDILFPWIPPFYPARELRSYLQRINWLRVKQTSSFLVKTRSKLFKLLRLSWSEHQNKQHLWWDFFRLKNFIEQIIVKHSIFIDGKYYFTKDSTLVDIYNSETVDKNLIFDVFADDIIDIKVLNSGTFLSYFNPLCTCFLCHKMKREMSQ